MLSTLVSSRVGGGCDEQPLCCFVSPCADTMCACLGVCCTKFLPRLPPLWSLVLSAPEVSRCWALLGSVVLVSQGVWIFEFPEVCFCSPRWRKVWPLDSPLCLSWVCPTVRTAAVFYVRVSKWKPSYPWCL